MSQENNQPVHRIRFGLVSAAIFRNTSSEVRDLYNTTFERSYRDGDDWKHTKSFRRDDLLVLAKPKVRCRNHGCGCGTTGAANLLLQKYGRIRRGGEVRFGSKGVSRGV